MTRFPQKQVYSRSRGAAMGAPGDGLEQGMAYAAVVQTPFGETLAEAVAKGYVPVTIPALHLTQVFSVHVQTGTPCAAGDAALVTFDETKTGWITTGAWAY